MSREEWDESKVFVDPVVETTLEQEDPLTDAQVRDCVRRIALHKARMSEGMVTATLLDVALRTLPVAQQGGSWSSLLSDAAKADGPDDADET